MTSTSFGALRFKTKGSDGGHNGLKDIQNVLYTTQYNGDFVLALATISTKGQQIGCATGAWKRRRSKLLLERMEVARKAIGVVWFWQNDPCHETPI